MIIGRKEGRDVRSHDGTYVLDLLDLLRARAHQGLERAEVTRESERGGLSYLADAERVQQARQGRPLALLYGRDQIRGGLLAHALEPDELSHRKPVKVRR